MTKLVIKIKRFDKSLPLPERKSKGAACLDLSARIDTTIEGQSFGKIPLNVAIEVPKGHWVMLAARSSTHKFGLIPANGIGIGDEDFCGNDDEYQLLVYNTTEKPVSIERGTRIAQMMVMPYETPEMVEVEEMQADNRGGIGSTGTK